MFFHFTKGAKQGDPLSPTFFILSVEVITRALNQFFEDFAFIGYSMSKWILELNHLAYANYTIIFTSSNEYLIKNIIYVLKENELESGQKIN